MVQQFFSRRQDQPVLAKDGIPRVSWSQFFLRDIHYCLSDDEVDDDSDNDLPLPPIQSNKKVKHGREANVCTRRVKRQASKKAYAVQQQPNRINNVKNGINNNQIGNSVDPIVLDLSDEEDDKTVQFLKTTTAVKRKNPADDCYTQNSVGSLPKTLKREQVPRNVSNPLEKENLKELPISINAGTSESVVQAASIPATQLKQPFVNPGCYYPTHNPYAVPYTPNLVTQQQLLSRVFAGTTSGPVAQAASIIASQLQQPFVNPGCYYPTHNPYTPNAATQQQPLFSKMLLPSTGIQQHQYDNYQQLQRGYLARAAAAVVDSMKARLRDSLQPLITQPTQLKQHVAVDQTTGQQQPHSTTIVAVNQSIDKQSSSFQQQQQQQQQNLFDPVQTEQLIPHVSESVKGSDTVATTLDCKTLEPNPAFEALDVATEVNPFVATETTASAAVLADTKTEDNATKPSISSVTAGDAVRTTLKPLPRQHALAPIPKPTSSVLPFSVRFASPTKVRPPTNNVSWKRLDSFNGKGFSSAKAILFALHNYKPGRLSLSKEASPDDSKIVEFAWESNDPQSKEEKKYYRVVDECDLAWLEEACYSDPVVL